MKKYKLIYLLFCILMLISCNKEALDKKPLDIITDADLWNDPTLINAYLTEVYYQMYFFANESGGSLGSGDGFVACYENNEIADECFPQWRDWNPSGAFRYKYGNLTIDGGLLEYWSQAYNSIRSINQYIERIPSSPFSADEIKAKIAEARFLRAFNYFALVKRYGGVPLITKTQQISDPQAELYPARDKEETVYDFIISEIDAIANDLPETVAGNGRPSKYAALALKSRAALYAGSIAQFGTVQLDGIVGIPADKANAYYQAAYNASNLIMTSGKYALYNADADKAMNFRNIFLVKNNSEVIFVKAHDAVYLYAGGNGWGIDFINGPRPNGWSRGLYDQAYLEEAEAFEHVDGTPGTLNRTAIQQGLWTTEELWANKDPRFFGTFYTQNNEWKGNKLDFHRGIRLANGTIQTDGSVNGIPANGDQDYEGTGIGILKYLDESHDNFLNMETSKTDWQIFRYAEVLLNYAEAAFELGKSNDALTAINQIRNRAGIVPLTSISRDQIRHERRVELAFEGHRYWDLRRWRTAVTDLSKSWSGIRYILDVQTGKYQLKVIDNIDGTSNVPQFRQENYYFPITISRTSKNPKLVENPGYN
jgi:hypothetical protein